MTRFWRSLALLLTVLTLLAALPAGADVPDSQVTTYRNVAMQWRWDGNVWRIGAKHNVIVYWVENRHYVTWCDQGVHASIWLSAYYSNAQVPGGGPSAYDTYVRAYAHAMTCDNRYNAIVQFGWIRAVNWDGGTAGGSARSHYLDYECRVYGDHNSYWTWPCPAGGFQTDTRSTDLQWGSVVPCLHQGPFWHPYIEWYLKVWTPNGGVAYFHNYEHANRMRLIDCGPV